LETAVALAQYRFFTKANKESGDMAGLDQCDFERVCDMTGQFKDDEEWRAVRDRARQGYPPNLQVVGNTSSS